MKLIEAAVRDAGAQIITLAVRRANTKFPQPSSLANRAIRTASCAFLAPEVFGNSVTSFGI